ncbi:MAG: leucine-rich repeat domain-containing protein [Faecalibacterium sp.]|nr:leucine-rich repeat domain-containing protein [Faecalibacterium sp.]
MDKYCITYSSRGGRARKPRPDDLPSTAEFEFSGRTLVLYRGSDSHVVVPQGCSSIGQAFGNRAEIRSVELPDTVTSIGDDAFADCVNLERIVMPPVLSYLGAGAFSGCAKLQAVQVPDGVTEIGDRAFLGCEALRTLQLPDGLLQIGEEAFWGCAALRQVTLPGGLQEIREGAFACSGLEEIYLPGSLRDIWPRAFADCRNLARMEFGWKPRQMMWNDTAITGCDRLQQLKVQLDYGVYRLPEPVPCESVIPVRNGHIRYEQEQWLQAPAQPPTPGEPETILDVAGILNEHRYFALRQSKQLAAQVVDDILRDTHLCADGTDVATLRDGIHWRGLVLRTNKHTYTLTLDDGSGYAHPWSESCFGCEFNAAALAGCMGAALCAITPCRLTWELAVPYENGEISVEAEQARCFLLETDRGPFPVAFYNWDSLDYEEPSRERDWHEVTVELDSGSLDHEKILFRDTL